MGGPARWPESMPQGRSVSSSETATAQLTRGRRLVSRSAHSPHPPHSLTPSPPSPPSLPTLIQTELRAADVTTKEAEEEMAALQATVSELQASLDACQANLDLSTSRIDKCSSFVRQLLIEKVSRK